MKRIGLLGGSFDPVHNAHLSLAQAALEHLGLDRLLWIPAGLQWQKTRVPSPAADRLAMVRLAIADEPRFVAETCELDRDGPSYTIDTIEALQAAEPGREWFLVIGQDQYSGLHTWHRYDELLGKVTLAVARRGSAELQVPPELVAHPHKAIALPSPLMAISSTQIRANAATGQDYSGMVPAAVARYIDLHRLYQRTTRS